MYILHTKYRRSFSSMSHSSDEMRLIQVMVIARNKRLAERFLVLSRCANYYKDVASFIRTFNLSVGVVSLKFLNNALYVTIEVELLQPFLIKLH